MYIENVFACVCVCWSAVGKLQREAETKKNKKENTLARRKNKQKQSKSENCALSDAERERKGNGLAGVVRQWEWAGESFSKQKHCARYCQVRILDQNKQPPVLHFQILKKKLQL